MTIKPDESFVPKISLLIEGNVAVSMKIISYFGEFIPDTSKDHFVSNNTNTLFSISTNKPVNSDHLNSILKGLRYYVAVYDAKPLIDYINVILTVEGDFQCEVVFPISIRRPKLPILQFRNDNTVISSITILTKVWLAIFVEIVPLNIKIVYSV